MYRVLVADDELWMTLSIKKLIEKSGLPFRVIGEVMNGVAALEAVEREKPDLLITDIRMPGYDGLELLEQMKKKCLATKVILLSGYAEFEYARKAIRLDAFDYLLKPVKQEQLEQLENLAAILAAFCESRNCGHRQWAKCRIMQCINSAMAYLCYRHGRRILIMDALSILPFRLRMFRSALLLLLIKEIEHMIWC